MKKVSRNKYKSILEHYFWFQVRGFKINFVFFHTFLLCFFLLTTYARDTTRRKVSKSWILEKKFQFLRKVSVRFGIVKITNREFQSKMRSQKTGEIWALQKNVLEGHRNLTDVTLRWRLVSKSVSDWSKKKKFEIMIFKFYTF